MNPKQLLDRIIEWAESNDNVIVLIMTGSRTRQGEATDEFSDFDLELIAEDRDLLAEDDRWLHLFAEVWTVLALSEGQDNPTRLVIYEGGQKVDFTLANRDRVTSMIVEGQLDSLYERGYEVLFDKEGITWDLPKPTGAFPRVSLPSQEVFNAVVAEFWFEASHMPRYLQRNELWVVKFRDWTMKSLLLTVIEWHAVATSDEPVDVWHIGSHMQDWVDDGTWSDIQGVFSRFDAEDSWRGLIASMDVFRRLGREIAAVSELQYPDEVDRNIRQYVLSFADS